MPAEIKPSSAWPHQRWPHGRRNLGNEEEFPYIGMYFRTPYSRRVPYGSERALRFWRRRRFHRSSICRSEASKSSLDILVLNSLAELCVILYDVIRICSRQTVTMTCADTRAAAQLTRSKTCYTNDVQSNDKHGCIKIRATCNSV